MGAIAVARRTTSDKLRGQLRGDLDWITMRALGKDRTRRYGSAAELAADLRRHLGHEPVLAGPPSARYRTAKFVRRHRAGVAFASTLVVLLVGFGVTMAVQAGRIARECDRANAEASRASQEAERANRETSAAQEVTELEFLVGLFDASDPRVALGDTITVREILDLGAARIASGEVAQAPLQKARLLETMARARIMIGLILRMGLVTKNAILLVDFTNQRRARGADRRAALIDAGEIRLRPIVMTTLAMIFGMLPLALALGAGAEFRAPMARAVIGGLLTSSLLTPVVVPVVYTFFDDLGRRIGMRLTRAERERRQREGQEHEHEAVPEPLEKIKAAS